MTVCGALPLAEGMSVVVGGSIGQSRQHCIEGFAAVQDVSISTVDGLLT